MFYDKDYIRISHMEKVFLDLNMCDQFECDDIVKCFASYESDTEVVFYDEDDMGYSFSTEDNSIQLDCVSVEISQDEDTDYLL